MIPSQQSSATERIASGPLGTSTSAKARIPTTEIILRDISLGYANPLEEGNANGQVWHIRYCRLDSDAHHRYRKRMAQSFLVFDFGSDEELAQQARHRVDGWKQGFRLDKKLLLKFDRNELPEGGENAQGEENARGEKKASAKSRRKKPAESGAKESIQLIIRLDFSDHERLSHQRWLDRIPTEAPFKDAQAKIIRQNDAEFTGTAERFDSLP
jgi:hypothetical protein